MSCSALKLYCRTNSAGRVADNGCLVQAKSGAGELPRAAIERCAVCIGHDDFKLPGATAGPVESYPQWLFFDAHDKRLRPVRLAECQQPRLTNINASAIDAAIGWATATSGCIASCQVANADCTPVHML